ncbi:MAG TPA: agmatine deiminase family protein [Bacteroidales bacterium]|nr:agmatine deiminase family protein [Bacteroidales bacterium]
MKFLKSVLALLFITISVSIIAQETNNQYHRDWDYSQFTYNKKIQVYPHIYQNGPKSDVSGEDLGISEITTHYSSTFAYQDVPIAFYVKVNNYGSTAASGFTLTITDNGSYNQSVTISTLLNSGTYTIYEFPCWIPSSTGNKTITATVNNSGDVVISNNTTTTTITVYTFQKTDPPATLVRSIAEFEPQRGALIRASVSGSSVTFGVPIQLIREIAEEDTLYIVCSNQTAANTIQNYLTNNTINSSQVKYIFNATNSHWTRDYGPWFVENETHQLEVIDFPYNRNRPNDSQVPRAFANATGNTIYGMPLLHTGGNFMTDGMGVAASCDLVDYENSCYNQNELDSLYLNYLGITTYHTIPDPLNSYIQHIDCWGKFLAPDKIMILQVPSNNANYSDLENAAQYFANLTSSYGNKYKVYRVYTPNNQPYTNSLILNNKVLVPMNPTYGSSCYQAALDSYQQAMPGYEIIGVSYNDWYDTDALHCRAIQLPQSDMLRIVHQPILDSIPFENSVTIAATVYTLGNNSGITYDVKLHYQINQNNYQTLDMILQSSQYEAVIQNLNPNDTVRYYIEATNSNNKHLFHPFAGVADPHRFYLKSGTSISSWDSALQFNVYPNPASQNVFIEISDEVFNVEIYTLIGKLISRDYNNKILNIEALPPGTYILKVTSNNKVGYRKIVIY